VLDQSALLVLREATGEGLFVSIVQADLADELAI
jgi:hypothetical protein